jgi:hypothetical protein
MLAVQYTARSAHWYFRWQVELVLSSKVWLKTTFGYLVYHHQHLHPWVRSDGLFRHRNVSICFEYVHDLFFRSVCNKGRTSALLSSILSGDRSSSVCVQFLSTKRLTRWALFVCLHFSVLSRPVISHVTLIFIIVSGEVQTHSTTELSNSRRIILFVEHWLIVVCKSMLHILYWSIRTLARSQTECNWERKYSKMCGPKTVEPRGAGENVIMIMGWSGQGKQEMDTIIVLAIWRV